MKKIGLVIPHIVSNVDRELIQGIFSYLKGRNCNLFIITGISNFNQRKHESNYVDGIQNIYSILQYADLDGVIFAADAFTSQEVKDDIYAWLKERKVPVLVLEEKNPWFPYLYPEQEGGIYDITTHLIREHGCQKIWFLAGIKGHIASEERQAGYERAMRNHGIEITSDMIFHGDFWQQKPYELGKIIAQGKIEKPDAVVCANDMMALYLVRGLTEHGLCVPEDIRVTGCDGLTETILNDPPITTIIYRNFQLGYDAAAKLYHIIAPDCKRTGKVPKKQTILYGTSCGCSRERMVLDDDIWQNLRRLNAFHFDRYEMMSTDFLRNLTNCETLYDLMFQAASFCYRIPNWKMFHIYLCEDWLADISNYTSHRKEGFSDKMIVALEKTGLLDEGRFSEKTIFTRDLISDNALDESLVYLLTSLHSNGQIFGYLCTAYHRTEDIFLDDNYCIYCDALNRGLQETQQRINSRSIREKMDMHFDMDPETSLLNKRGFLNALPAFVQEHKTVCITAICVSTEVDQSALDQNNILLFAIKSIAAEDELWSHPAENLYVFASEISSDHDNYAEILKRIDRIENEMLKYDIGEIRMILPEFAIKNRIIDAGADNIAEIIEMQIRESVNVSELYSGENQAYIRDFLRLRREMKMYPELEWDLNSIAQKLSFSRSHMQRLYRSLFGQSCKEDLIDIRIAKAKRLLVNTDMKINEIAYLCGYDNGSHFMRQFRDKTGTTATGYRKNPVG